MVLRTTHERLLLIELILLRIREAVTHQVDKHQQDADQRPCHLRKQNNSTASSSQRHWRSPLKKCAQYASERARSPDQLRGSR